MHKKEKYGIIITALQKINRKENEMENINEKIITYVNCIGQHKFETRFFTQGFGTQNCSIIWVKIAKLSPRIILFK